nr:hypothetical protein [uncultured Aminipila sp.]
MLIKCPECEKDISANSISCFYCGCVIEEKDENIVEENIAEEDTLSSTTTSSSDSAKSLEYNKIGKTSIIVGCIFWAIGFFKIFIYNGGDTYNIIINATYFAGLAVIGGALIISGVLVMIYGKLKDK